MTSDGQNKAIGSKLDEVDVQMLRLIQETPTITDSELSRVLGLSRSSIQRRRASRVTPHLQADLLVLDKNRNFLISKAFKTIDRLLGDSNSRIALEAAQTVLAHIKPLTETKPNNREVVRWVTSWGGVTESDAPAGNAETRQTQE